MTRQEQRETAFLLIFEHLFHGMMIEEILNAKELAGEKIKLTKFSQRLFDGAVMNYAQLDHFIERHLISWGKDRLSRVATAILRLSVFEMRFCEETPENVAINEAVELAKKYSTPDEAAFINGVLGGISRGKVEIPVQNDAP